MGFNSTSESGELALDSGPSQEIDPSIGDQSWPRQPRNIRNIAGRSPLLYLTVFSSWFICLLWFHDKLYGLLESTVGIVATGSVIYFVVFTQVAWLFGIYNLTVIVFSVLSRYRRTQACKSSEVERTEDCPPVAVLFTTCDDFMLESAVCCLGIQYPNYRIYILDDSTDPYHRDQIDRFAALDSSRIEVVRRRGREGRQAGNLNHALTQIVTEPLFVITDSNETIPSNFLSRLVPRIEAEPNCGFVQAIHRNRFWGKSRFEQDLGVSIDIQRSRYHPLKNRYGFVTMLGRGALLRTECWRETGGFPEFASVGQAFSLAIRERGYYGIFADDVICFEKFPSSVRSFRIRHVKQVRGICEFLDFRLLPLLRSRNISWVEKIDVVFPALNLPLSFFFFLFLLNAAILVPAQVGEIQSITLEAAGRSYQVPLLLLPAEFGRLISIDFFVVTVLTLIAPMLCFLTAMWHTPLRLLRFVCNSTALYSALSPLSMLCVSSYLLTRKTSAIDNHDDYCPVGSNHKRTTMHAYQWGRLFRQLHPDHPGVAAFEILSALAFVYAAIICFQVSLLGIALAFAMLPAMHYMGWDNFYLRAVRYTPLILVSVGLALGGFSLFGIAPVMFSIGFHF